LRPDPARGSCARSSRRLSPAISNPTDKTRANHIVDRVLALDSEAVVSQLADVLENFLGRHRNLLEKFEARADEMEEAFATHESSRRSSVSSSAPIFSMSIRSKLCLVHPSIVPHPDQSDAPKGGLRFILSLRAVGEGHVSSLSFAPAHSQPTAA